MNIRQAKEIVYGNKPTCERELNEAREFLAGYSDGHCSAPANNASAARWAGYHAAEREEDTAYFAKRDADDEYNRDQSE